MEAGGGKVYIMKKSTLNPLLIWTIYLTNQLLMEGENRVTVEAGCKFQGLLSLHVGENARVRLKLRMGGGGQGRRGGAWGAGEHPWGLGIELWQSWQLLKTDPLLAGFQGVKKGSG